MNYRFATGLLFAAGLTSGLAAVPLKAEAREDSASAAVQSGVQANRAQSDAEFERLTSTAKLEKRTLDYKYLTEALDWLVLPMGPSLREGAPRVEGATGTRRIYGHTSRYRLEGNRVAFSFIEDDQRAGLSDYLNDLERIGTEFDVARWPRNEQLAYWMNLHNVAILEAIAKAYPLSDPSRHSFVSGERGLQDAKLVTVKGVALSPRDIRERIVYPNWEDPKVIYGFWRGDIGGPSIQRLAFNGANVDDLLSWSAQEYVNSLRGVEKYYGALQVSKIYEEATPFFFETPGSLRSHLSDFAGEDVKALLEETEKLRFKHYESDVADLRRGTKDLALTQYFSFVDLVGNERNFRSYSTANANIISPNSPIDPAIQRLINERANKLNKAIARGIRTGTVIVGEGEGTGKEVE